MIEGHRVDTCISVFAPFSGHLELHELLAEILVLKPLLQVRVEPILDLIVCASWYVLGHLTPARLKSEVQFNDEKVL